MATASARSVTIDRGHFETLLRRANCGIDDSKGGFTGVTPESVAIAKVDYESLVSIARRYGNLRKNLVNGGVSEAMIDLLGQDDYTLQQQSTGFAALKQEGDGGARFNASMQTQAAPNLDVRSSCTAHHSWGPGNGAYKGGHGIKAFSSQPEWADADAGGDEFSGSYSIDGPTPEPVYTQQFEDVQTSQRPQFARMCKRTVMLAGLADGTTHEDITSVVRGGLLLEVYVRAAEHSALVSFLLEEDAVRFYEFARRNDLYIKNKRVFIKWADRHFHLAGHVAGKIGIGATRNLIIRRCDPEHTADSIREDLEHIHNLVVIKVEFVGGSCFIKTNSVHNAMFARTCMMSRAKYKGSKIEWDVDECQQPLEVIQKPSPPRFHQVPPAKKPVVNMRNRFATLRLDDNDDQDSDDKLDSSSDLLSAGTVNVTA